MRLLLLLRCAPITKIHFDHIFKKHKLKKGMLICQSFLYQDHPAFSASCCFYRFCTAVKLDPLLFPVSSFPRIN